MADFPTQDPGSDHSGGLNHNPESFVVDLGRLSNGAPNPRISNVKSQLLQKSFSRKGSFQGGDHHSLLHSPSSPTAAGPAGPNATPEKPATPTPMVAVEVNDHAVSQPRHHNPAALKSRWGRRYNSFKRSPPPAWFYDPKRVLLLFATLSSVGTILLIYVTLAMRRPYDNDGGPEW